MSIMESIEHIWNFVLFNVDASPITLGKVVIGLGLMVVGYFLAKTASRMLGRRVIARLKIEEALKYTLERLLFYFIYIFVCLFVLQLLSIPVGIFALIGGALAIGLGFGSQNVVNNFISGLIVMVEQPVRVGDWIEIDGMFGQVEGIGSRSTYILISDNKQAIIPNSYFLEKMYTNWTLNDNRVSGKLSIGVAYGTDPKLVKSVLLQAAAENPDVLKSPAPTVVFQDFAESSLNFDLVYWIAFTADRTVKSVASDLRFRLDEIFRSKDISIPFPHREVILQASKPLPVEVHGPH